MLEIFQRKTNVNKEPLFSRVKVKKNKKKTKNKTQAHWQNLPITTLLQNTYHCSEYRDSKTATTFFPFHMITAADY